MTTISAILAHPAFIASIRASSPNQERNEKILKSLAEIAALPAEEGSITTLGEVTSAANLGFAFNAISFLKNGGNEITPIIARRTTCADITAAIKAAGVGIFRGDVSPWFNRQVQSWSGSADHRLAAMAATAKRELDEVLAPPEQFERR